MSSLDYILDKFGLKKGKLIHKLYRSKAGSLSLLIKELNLNAGAEVGVNTGKFSKFLYSLNPKLKLFAIDEWKSEEIFNKAQKRLRPLTRHLFRQKPMDAVKRFADNTLDFVFVNTPTNYKDAKENIQEWSKKVKNGGIVAGQGYDGSFFGKTYGVKKAVDQWVNKNKIKPLFVLKKDSSPTWFYVKNA